MSKQQRPIDESVRQTFEEAWLAGNPVSIRQCIRPVQSQHRSSTLVELVAIEMEFSWKNRIRNPLESEPPKLLEDYVEEFPELATSEFIQELLEEEYQIRRRCGDSPDYAEFEKRFPQWVDSLGFTEADNSASSSDWSVPSLAVGQTIDRYTLRQEIGEGGMGRVFVAEQLKPVQRTVALKVIKKGANSKKILARFDAERQALAMMNHPNIARILDGGSTDVGQPYFVMEFVDGIPITDYCDNRRLGLNERLELFCQVCSAVQHAHQKGIIHRDLKPSNVLVAEYEGKPRPKVIDFGLAKAIHGQELLTEATMETQIGEILGTYKYMSPEQADPAEVDIDTRTDIYALGVILYELLTGSTPLERQQVQQRLHLDVLRTIREYDPPKPSLLLNSLHESATTVSENRQMNTTRLSNVLRGDLDWVVMKAIEKDRRRRYETAVSFSDDVRRFLEDEPIIARPPSAIYRLRKSFRRHRFALTSAATVLLLLLAGIAGTSYGLFNATRQRELAEKATIEAIDAKNAEKTARIEADEKRQEAEESKEAAVEARKEAEKAQQQTEKSLARTRRVLDFVVSIFRKPDPSADGRKVTIASVLENAMRDIDNQLGNDPVEKSTLLDAFGRSFTGLGIFELAIEAHRKSKEVAEQAWGKDSRIRADAATNLAFSLADDGQLKEAEREFTEALRNFTAAYGSEHPKTTSAKANIAFIQEKRGHLQEATQTMETVYQLKMKHSDSTPRQQLKAMIELIQTYAASKELGKRLPLAKQAVEFAEKSFGIDHERYIAASHNYAVALHDAAQFNDALRYRRIAYELSREINGQFHPETNQLLGYYATESHAAGNSQQAISLFDDQIERSTELLGEDHPMTLRQLNNMGQFYSRIGEPVKAMEIRTQVYKLARNKLGEDHPDTLVYLNNYAKAINNTGRFDQALPLFEKLLRLRTEKLGESHPDTINSVSAVGLNQMYLGNREQAVEFLNRARELRAKELGDLHIDTLHDRRLIGQAYVTFRQGEKAVEVLEPTLADAHRVLGDEHPDTLQTMQFLATAYGMNGQQKRAVKMLVDAFEVSKKRFGEHHTGTIEAMQRLAMAYGTVGETEKTIELSKRMLTIVKQRFGDEHSAVYLPLAMLSMSYSNLQQIPEAIDYTCQALDILSKWRKPNNIQITQNKIHLAQLYLQSGRFAEAHQLLQEHLDLLSDYQGEENNITLLQLLLCDTQLGLNHSDEANEMMKVVMEDHNRLSPEFQAVATIISSELQFGIGDQSLDGTRIQAAVDDMMKMHQTLRTANFMYVFRGYQLLIKLADSDDQRKTWEDQLARAKILLK